MCVCADTGNHGIGICNFEYLRIRRASPFSKTIKGYLRQATLEDKRLIYLIILEPESPRSGGSTGFAWGEFNSSVMSE